MVVKSKPVRGTTPASRRRLLVSACSAALALALLLPSAAWANDYPVNSESDLQAALAEIAGNSDTTPRIVLGSSFSISSATLNLPAGKTVTIDTQGFVITTPTGVGMTLSGLNGTTGLNLSGTYTGVSAAVAGSPGSGLVLNGTGTVTSSATITSGSTSNPVQAPGIALSLSNAMTFVNNGTVAAGDSIAYTHTVSGSNTGVAVSLNGGGTLVNNGLVQGSNGQGGADGFAVYTRGTGGASFIVNNGTIRGGSNADLTTGGAAIRGFGGTSIWATVTNNSGGLIEGGNGAAAFQGFTQPWYVSLINDGTVSAGAGGTTAIDLSGNANSNLMLELRAGSVINGNVLASTGTTDKLILGGSVDSSFDVSQIGAAAKYRNFNLFEKTGTGKWTLTGDTATPIAWNIVQGTLEIGDGTTTGPLLGAVTNNGVLAFNQSGTFTMDPLVGNSNIGGNGSVLQSGSGTTILGAVINGYAGGTTITNGVLQIAFGGALGTGALHIDGGTLRVTGSGSAPSTTALGSHGGIFDITSASGIYIVSGLAGGGALLKTGAGGLTLNGDSSYTGGTTIAAGTLRVNGAIVGDIVNDGALIFGNATAYAFGGLITGTGDVTAGGAGQLTLTRDLSYGGATTVTGTGGLLITNGTTISYGGGTALALNSGGLRVTGGANVTSGGSTSVNRGTALTVDGANSVFSAASFGGTITGAGTIAVNVANGGTIRTTIAGFNFRTITAAVQLSVDGMGSLFDMAGGLNGASQTSAPFSATVSGGASLRTAGTSQIGLATTAGTVPLAISIAGAGSNWTSTNSLLMTTGNFTVNQGGAATFTDATFGTSTGSGALATLTVSGAGSRFVTTSGDLAIGSGSGKGVFNLSAGASASVAGSLRIGNASAVALDAASAHVGGDLVIGTATGTGTLTLANGSAVDVAGNLVLGTGAGSGEIALASGNTLTIGGVMFLADSGTATGILSLGGAQGQAAATAGAFTAPTLSFGSATSRLNFNHTDTDYVFGAAFLGAGTVDQVAGDTNLTGTSTGFTGVTNVTGGTLRVNGTLGDATSMVNVSTGGRLGGAGTIGGDVFVTDGVLAPGNSPGTLTVAGDLSLTGASVLDYEFGHSNVVGGPLNDLAEVGGDLTLDGTINVTVTPGGDFGVGVYRVISYNGSVTDNGLTVGSTPSSGIVQAQTSVFGQVNLVNYAGKDVNFWDTGATAGDGVISGGTGMWQAATGNTHWTLFDGSANASYADGNFAIFMANAGMVTVDTSFGAVNASGMQFVTDGYTITGAALGLTGAESIFRVGDGTAAGAGYTATITNAMTGAGSLVKTDLGTLVLTGASSFAGEGVVRSGTLQLSGGGTLGNAGVRIGRGATDQAIVTVTGIDGAGNASTWTSTGNLRVGDRGTGTLNVLDGGAVHADDIAYIGDSAGAVGTATVSGVDANGHASSWTNANDLVIGEFGTGTLNISGGGQVSNVSGWIGSNAGAQGTVTVSGNDGNGNASTWTNSADLLVGNTGTGTLNVLAGGVVNSGTGWIGASAGGVGIVNVSGTDGGGNASTWAVSGGLAIGNGGTGTLNVTAGGKVTSGNANIGWDPAAIGHALVSGAGSTWDSTGRISVGSLGAADIRIEDGGKVSSDDAIIGASSHGEAVVTGAGSTWTTAGQFTVGLTATAMVRIENGASVVSGQGYVGANSGGGGVVIVTGAGSSWLVGPSSITIGNNASGVVSIDGGARVRAEGGIILAGSASVSGTLTLAGTAADRAVLETAGIGKGTGVANLNLDGALLRATDSNNDFFSGFGGQNIMLGAEGLAFDTDTHVIFVSQRLTGAGAFIKDGAGALVLREDSTYTGGTTINAGIVQLGDGGTTGSILGDVVNNGSLEFYRSDDFAFDGLISGSGAVTHYGPGTLALTAANSYAGATNVSNDGTLLINGDQTAATGLTTVAAAATLGGTGIIGGSVNMSAGGTLAAGAGGAGTLTINGNLALGSDTHLAFDLGQAGTAGGALNDLVDVGGNLTLDGTVNVTQSAGGTFGFGIYRLFDYAGTLTNNGLTVGTTPAGDEAFIQTSVANQVNLINTAGMQLNFWDGAAGPKFDGAINGGSGVWQAHSGNDNWTDPNGAINAGFSDGAVAIFTGTAGTVTVSNLLGTVTTSGMQFATTGYIIAGDPLTLTGAQAVIRVGDGSAAGAGYTTTLLSELTGASQLVKTDLGTLALIGNNSYTGGTRIEGGILRLGNGGATGSITGDIVDNASLVVNRSGTITLDGAISGTGTLTKLGSGTLVLSGANSFAGGTLVGGGTVQVSSAANLGDVAGTLSLQGGTLQAAAGFTSARAILLGSNNSNTIDTQGFDVTLGGAIGNGPNNQAGNFVNKIGSGTLTLTGANSYANRTVIAGGTLALASAGTAGAGNLVIGAGTVFDISQADVGARVVQLNSGAAGTIALGSKALTLGLDFSFSDWSGTITDGGIAGGTGGSVVITAPNGAVRFFEANSYTGGTTVAGGTFALGGNGALHSGGAVTVNGGAAFDIRSLAATGTTIGDLSGAGTIVLGGKSLTFGTGNSTAFSGTITGNGGALVKNGTGAFALTGANDYTGTTDVNAGTLLIDGDQSAATGLTTVASGATLGGSGTIGGDVVVADGGTLSPGNSPGTLTVNGSLTLSGGSTLAYELGAANAVGNPLNDLVNVGGDLTLDGTINVAVSAGGSFDIGLYRIANYGGVLTNNGLAIGTMPAGANLFVQTSITGQVNLVNTGSAVLNFWDGSALSHKFNTAVDGGDGMWRTALDDSWTEMTGAVNAPYDNGAFAIFAGTGGEVTIDGSQGAVSASGLQFAANGYRIQGDALTLTGPQSVIRVGDGTNGGGAYTATIGAEIAGSTQVVKTDLGTLILTGTNSYTGGTLINGGTVRIASDSNLGAAAGGLGFNGGTLSTMADMSSARAVDLAGQAVLSINAGTTLTLTGNVTGAGNLAKTDTGTLALTGTGSYAGGTEVARGTLLVNGDFGAATGPTHVAAGATLGGTGIIGGDVNLAGTLAPGAGGAGTLTINGDLTIGQGATLAYEFGQAGIAGGALNDLVKVGGDLTLDGTIDITVPTGGTFGAGIYRVFDYDGAITDNGLTLGALPAGSNVAVQTSIAGQVNLVNFAGLTLTFWDGATGPKNNGIVDGGTGIWQLGAASDNWTDAGGTINAAYSNGGFAVFGGTSATVTVDNAAGQVTAAGMQFASSGYTVAGGEIALTGPQSTIRVGDGSTAGATYTATINAALSGATQLVKTDAGTLVLGGVNSYSGGTAIDGGTVQISSDANLGAAAGGLALDGGTLATTASITSARTVTVAGPGTFSTATGTTLTLTGTLSGSGALAKTGTGKMVVTGNGTSYTGAVTVAGGTLDVRGTIGSAATVETGARLEGTGRLDSVTNRGTVAPGGDALGTLTLAGNYASSGGTLEIATVLGDDASATDRLVVGGSTSGSTEVVLTNRGGLGAQTVAGIKIVDVAGASDGVFALRGDYQFEGSPALIAGAYGYRLYKGGVATPSDGDWYLRSALLSGTGPQLPLYQPGVPVYEAYGQTMLALNDIGTMQERTGNRQWAHGEDGKTFGIWGRTEASRSRPNAAFSTSLADVNVDSWKFELGADQVVSQRGDGAKLVLGILGSYGEAKAAIRSPYGNGGIKTRGYGAGATLSWFGPQGFYVDSRAQVTWFDSDLKSTVLGKLAEGNNGTGEAYSLEVGKRSPVGGSLSVTPQIQMVYSTVGFDRFTDPNGADISSRLGDSLKTRWGISLDRQDATSHLYGVANLSYEWLDGTIADVSGTPIARANDRLWGALGLGGSVTLNNRLVLYSEASADTALRDFGKSYNLKGVAGLRLAF